jgi:RNA polymerase sigma-70 factor (ECF subfamily)
MENENQKESLDLTDEEIVLLVQKGNKEHFELIITRYTDKLNRYLNKFLSNQEDKEDLLQDVFIKCFININSFDIGQKFSPWIYRIAHNEAVNLLKKNSNRPFSFDIFDEALSFTHPKAKEDSENDSEKLLIKKYLDSILEEIDGKYKEIIVLYFYEDLSYKDISDVLKIPISLVGVRIQRGKKEIKKILEEKKFN